MKQRNSGKSGSARTTTRGGAARAVVPDGVTIDGEREVKPRAVTPAAEDVRRRAYEIYLGRMQTGEPGSPEADWERAERELGGF